MIVGQMLISSDPQDKLGCDGIADLCGSAPESIRTSPVPLLDSLLAPSAPIA